jgi:leucyl aminopeptidase (aminopeptidase T)
MASQSSKSSPKKPKLVRDSFTIPKSEFVAIDALKTRAIALGMSVKKSELLRAGLMVLQGLGDGAYKGALAAVPTLKTGRPTGADKPATAAPAKAAAKTSAKVGSNAAASAPGNTTTPSPTAKAPAGKVVARKPAAKKVAARARKAA